MTNCIMMGVHSYVHVSVYRNGAVPYESVMKLRNKLDDLGKMEGVNTAEKGPFNDVWSSAILHHSVFLHRS